MSIWFQRKRSVAHPEWLDSALTDIAGFHRISKLQHFPSVLQYPMLVTHIKRLSRVAWPSYWRVAWFFFCAAFSHEREHLVGIAYRFWRYRILMHSQDRDLYEMASYPCPECKTDAPFSETSQDVYICDHCGWKTDSAGLCELITDEEE